MRKIVSNCNDAANIIKIVEINKTEIFSLKFLKSFNELIPKLLNVNPIAVTESNPVPWTSSSGKVNTNITTINTAGDFKNSGMCPDSNIQPIKRPNNQPSKIASPAVKKKISNVIPSRSAIVKNEIISNAKTANKTRSEEHTSELQSRGHLVCRL